MSGSAMLGVVIAAGGVYALGSARLAARSERSSRRWKIVSASGAFASLALLELPALHHLAEELFTFHMIGHIVLAGLVAPLLILADPVAPLLWSLPGRVRALVAQLLGLAWLRGTLHLLCRPVPATALHGVALWAWHVPAFYDLAMADPVAHWLQHASFLVTALFFWSAVFRDRQGATAVMIILVTLIHTGLLGALLTFSPTPLYAGHDPAGWGLTALEDQQLAGLIMWVPASFMYLAAAVAIGARLLEQPESS